MRKQLGTLALITSIIGFPQMAMADAGKFVSEMAGEYVGRGTAAVGPTQKVKRVSCKISNKFSEGKKALDLRGQCATTQGKRNVSGRLNYAGNSVSGTVLSGAHGYKVTKSTGSVKGNTLTLSVSMMDERLNKLVRGRQVLVKTAKGFKSTVYSFDNKTRKFKKVGSINFVKK